MDGGDMLGSNLTGDRDRADLIFGAMEKMGYRVAEPGEKDISYGWGFIDTLAVKHHVKWLSANLYDPNTHQRLLPAFSIFQVGNMKVGVFGVMSPTLTITPTPGEITPEVHDAVEAARVVVPELRDSLKCQAVVALLHMPSSQCAELLKLVPGIDLAVYGHDGGIRSDLETVEQTKVVRVGDRGQRVAIVDIARSQPDSALAVTGEVVLLAEGVPDNTAMGTALKAADDEIKGRASLDAARTAATRELARGDDHYLGDAMCARCHESYVTSWADTKHSHAFQTLEDKQEDKDASCLACHVTGFGKASGYVEAHASPDLRNVQCEACHGVGTAHGPGYAAAAKASCTVCHDAKMSPGFDYNSAWQKIQHPKPALKLSSAGTAG